MLNDSDLNLMREIAAIYIVLGINRFSMTICTINRMNRNYSFEFVLKTEYKLLSPVYRFTYSNSILLE